MSSSDGDVTRNMQDCETKSIAKKASISVIVPVYNVEKVLKKCLDSIINQTYANLEIILINDGSSDNSPKICEEYSTQDKRIKYINQKNGGVASARNNGLKEATGDYIHFVDSDDFIELNMYEILIKIALEHSSDFVACSCFLDYESGEQEIKGYNDNKLKEMSANEYFKNYLEGNFYLTVWNHICKADVCKNIKFPEWNETKFCEDGLTAIPTLLNAKHITYLGVPLYHYFQRIDENSIVRGKITLSKIRSWFLQYDSWLIYSKTQGKIFDKLIIKKYKNITEKFAILLASKLKFQANSIVSKIFQKLFSCFPYFFASKIAKLFPKN